MYGNTKNNKVQCVKNRLPDGTLIEMVFTPDSMTGGFIVCDKDGNYFPQNSFTREDRSEVLIPLVDEDVTKGRLILPSDIDDSKSPDELLADVQAHLHSYLDLDPTFEQIAARYVLFTWVYDAFTFAPYLRVIGEPGSGKTRFLQVMAGLCYHSFLLGAAVTEANIFRINDKFQGATLLLDEFNQDYSSRRSKLIQTLNVGTELTGTVTRTNLLKDQSKARSAFGPKIIASHENLDDPAIESRMITQETYVTKRRDLRAIPSDPFMDEEALKLRNQLLSFRMKMFHKIKEKSKIDDLAQFTPRTQDVFNPLFQITDKKKISSDEMLFIQQYNEDLFETNQFSEEGLVAQIYLDLLTNPNARISPGLISKTAKGNGYFIHSKRVGKIMRRFGAQYNRQASGMVYQQPTNKMMEKIRKFTGME